MQLAVANVSLGAARIRAAELKLKLAGTPDVMPEFEPATIAEKCSMRKPPDLKVRRSVV